MAREITDDESRQVQQLVANARAAMQAADSYDQAEVDRIIRAVAWAGGNEPTALKLANMSVDESGMGGREPTRRGKILGILRDALRQKSMGVIEENPALGIVKYAKPAGVIAALVPVTSPYVTPIGMAIYALKCKDAMIFSPHPGSRNTTMETVRIMRAALAKLGAPVDLLQCVDAPSIPLANRLMSSCDLTMATGGRGHSCGIYSFDDDHIHRLALMAPVSRIMVRQIQSRANAGTFTNGMPMTSSMGCGVWGGNITNENVSLKHYMNVTWVSRPIPEDRPSDEELFGEFYNTEIF